MPSASASDAANGIDCYDCEDGERHGKSPDSASVAGWDWLAGADDDYCITKFGLSSQKVVSKLENTQNADPD
jgi:hypothetical protein